MREWLEKGNGQVMTIAKLRQIITDVVCLVLVLLMVGMSIYSYNLGKKSVNRASPRTDTTTIYRDITYSDTIYTPKQFVSNSDTIFDTLHHYRIDTVLMPTVIDTLEVIKSYYESVIAIDTILNDTNGFIVIADSISKNRIQSRTINSMKLYPRVTKVTKYRAREFKRAYFGGIGLVGNEK
ncbi:MAG: hypothetical protein GY914_08910, partial [Prochlorococcus sp.]|nr:hypothetical protein [Prochlorococcus sp.]